MTPNAVGVTDVTVELGGSRVLDRITLEVATGEWVSIIGPNGAGKSTLLRAVAGLLDSGGSVELLGSPLRRLSRRERARTAALVPQIPIIPPGMAVVDYVLLGRTPHLAPLGREGAADLAAVHAALVQLDLLTLADRRLDTLSGGERQRVLIARALAQAAPILLLDEPTSALDVGHQQDVLELVDRLRRANDLTVVSTMHDLTLAGEYADRLILLDRGRVVAEGDAAVVLTEAHLARFYGANVRIIHDDGALVVVPVRRAEELEARDDAS
jgi:cobalamin transport system ATP-binding protein